MTTGMEFASEMIVMALKKNLRIFELPVNYHKRKGVSKLKRLSDGWRHLRFMLLYKPFFLFYPDSFGVEVWLKTGADMVIGMRYRVAVERSFSGQ